MADEPAIITDMGFPPIIWYSAITWRHAPQGVAGASQRVHAGPPAIAIDTIGMPGYWAPAVNIAVLSAQSPEGEAEFS